MSIFSRTLGATPALSSAAATMRELNPRHLVGAEHGRQVFIEDHADADGRMYRLEYQCDGGGQNAQAYCRYNPWGGNPYTAIKSHLFEDGRICLGDRAYSLQVAVLRARYWCTGYSYLREHGKFPDG